MSKNIDRPIDGLIAATNAHNSICNSKVEFCNPTTLVPYAGNARTHSRKQVRQIADSIKRFGFTKPVLIDDAGMILAGHGRVLAALELGLGAVPCLRLSLMSAIEKRAYILADNKLALNAGWDENLLSLELQALIECPDVIDIDVTGFEIAEIDELIDIGGTDPESESDRDDRVPEADGNASAVTQPGDLWVLDDHKLICGDARDADVYRHLLRSNHGDAVVTKSLLVSNGIDTKLLAQAADQGFKCIDVAIVRSVDMLNEFIAIDHFWTVKHEIAQDAIFEWR